ncbi:hypothetical protein HAX54_026733 [Datura stramonium]|uniref:Uncharacterized protein n=1 Tax=Datura stramonium TaxID=4076 RepID=A0ABS8S852_DATST|nr:hypothetical protein [Datura stramonium]
MARSEVRAGSCCTFLFFKVLVSGLTVLDRLNYLRLDSNWFNGSIPPLNQTQLQIFNVSNNNLTGPVPVTPTLKKFNIRSFLWNPSLCGEVVNSHAVQPAL